MVRAIVFDFGGVLFSEGKSVAAARLAKEFGYNAETIRGVFTSPELVKLREGLIDDETCWRSIQKNLPAGYDVTIIERIWHESYEINEEIFKLVKQLHTRYTLVSFSGNIKRRLLYLDRCYGFRKYFTVEIYSFDYHMNKPDPKFVDAMISAVGFPPEEMVYIDDVPGDLVPAQERGVHTILYQGHTDQLKTSLRSLGVRS